MAGILKVDDLRGNTAAGDITITSEGGSATQSLQQGLAKAWFDIAQSNSISDSFNISGNTDNGTGDHTVSFTNSFSSADYAVGGMAQEDTGGGPRDLAATGTAASGNRRIYTGTYNAARDMLHSNGIICGDLA